MTSHKFWILLLLHLFFLLLISCTDKSLHTRAVYMLLDTSGTYTNEKNKAHAIINYLLGTLGSGESLAVARIDSDSFSEKDIIAKITFDMRPSKANAQKRAFQEKINQFISSIKGSSYTDITGGVIQAIEFLNETGAGKKHILIFSDLKEDLKKDQVRDFPILFQDIRVVAVNVTKLGSDNRDPRKYLQRVNEWQQRIESGGGSWRIVNDLERLDRILDDRS